ncbi:MAG: cysteine-S-conjugate beta-lyase [Candidatus Cloacimonadota bacterium]|nr:cysteine-S-conjugate beta-lyase [Candidatus Cloacimonadota bacterium]
MSSKSTVQYFLFRQNCVEKMLAIILENSILVSGGFMKFDFDTPIERDKSDSIKWKLLHKKFGYEDLLPLWVADMDFAIAPPIQAAIARRNQHPVYGYSLRPQTYYDSFTHWLQKRHNWQIEPNWILDVPGVVPAINFCIQALTNPDDKVLLFSPVYDPFFKAIKLNQRSLEVSNLYLENNEYRINFAELEEKLKQGIKMILFCSPHNPVGRVWQRDELVKLANLAIKYQVLIVSDEIHFDLVFSPNKHIPLASLGSNIAQQTITLTSPGKTFNIAGLGGGFAVIPNKITFALLKNHLDKNALHLGNPLTTAAYQAAYQDGEEWLEALLEYLYENYKFVKEECENLGIEVTNLQGTYLAWLNFSHFGLSQTHLEEIIYKKAKLGLVSGTQYGSNGKGFMRLNFGCPRQYLQTALQRLKVIFPF